MSSTITTNNGTEVSYTDLGSGEPVVFSHGWPLCTDSWEAQMFFLAAGGYRCIVHDHRGDGRCSRPWTANEMDSFADELSDLIETLELKGAVLVGFSMGGGEVDRYIGRHGTNRLIKAALISAVPPLLLKTAADPEGPFFGTDRPDAQASQGMIDTIGVQQGIQADRKTISNCIRAFSETDFNEDLKKFDVPTLIVHGNNDQIVPIEMAVLRSARLVGNTTLKVYPGAPHGLAYTHKVQLNADLMAFLRS